MKGVIIIFISLLLFGCYTQSKFRKQLGKGDTVFPGVTSGFCATTFPVKEKVISDTVTLHDTLEIQGELKTDTIIKDNVITITKTLPAKTVTITNTVHVTDTIVKENTAAVRACEILRDQEISLLVDKTAEAKKYKGQARRRLWILLGLLLAAGVWTYFKFIKPSVKV